MKKILILTAILSWFVLISGSILVLAGLLMATASPGLLGLLTGVFLTSSIVLHSYAAIQLRKSILHPTIPLGRQTPMGIRFMGFAALFFALFNFNNALYTIQHTDQIAKRIDLPVQYKDLHVNINHLLHAAAIFSFVLSICIILNVLINLWLLRIYQAKSRVG
jgi:hypothetical protein